MFLFVVTNACVVCAVYLAAQRLLPRAALATRLTATCVCFVAFVVLLAQALSFFGLYGRGPALLASSIAALCAWSAWGSHAGVIVKEDVSVVRRWVRTTTTSTGGIVLAIALVALAALTWRALDRQPMGWDSLTYHLPAAAGYVQTGRLAALDGPLALDHYAHFPKNGEILASWLMLPVHADLLVGLTGVGCLVFGWLAILAMGRELDLSSRDAALAATAVCTSPFLYSLATTQNVDGLVLATLVSAVVFLTRYLSSGAGADAFFVCLSVALAVGTKYTALPLAGLVLALLGASAAIRLGRAGLTARLAAWALMAVVILAAVGGRQYVLNTVTTGNPIYPLTVAVAGVDRLAASPYTDRLVEELGTGSRADDRFQFSGMFHYYPDWKTPTSAGPKYVGLILLALLAAATARGRRAWAIRLIVVLAVAGVVVAELPQSGLPAISRRFWPASASRFMGVYFSLFAVAGLSFLSYVKGWRSGILRVALVCFIVWDLVAIGARRFEEVRGDGARRDYASAVDVDGAPARFVQGWQFVDQSEPLRIALVTGADLYGQNRFAFPLFGSRLQNTVLYVPVNESDPPASRAFVLRENPRYPDWLHGLETRRVQLVCAQDPWPIEDSWMREHPEQFALVHDDPHFRAYRFDTPPQTLAR